MIQEVIFICSFEHVLTVLTSDILFNLCCRSLVGCELLGGKKRAMNKLRASYVKFYLRTKFLAFSPVSGVKRGPACFGYKRKRAK